MNIEIFNFKIIGDERGSLIALEECKNIPFKVKRVYYSYNMAEKTRRGSHAHKTLDQILICVKGSCAILMDDGTEKQEVLLDSPEKGLLVGKMAWHEMYGFSQDCVLLVLASDYYDENDYIRNYERFLKECMR